MYRHASESEYTPRGDRAFGSTPEVNPRKLTVIPLPHRLLWAEVSSMSSFLLELYSHFISKYGLEAWGYQPLWLTQAVSSKADRCGVDERNGDRANGNILSW